MTAATGSGPRHVEAELPSPVLTTNGAKSLIEVYSQPMVATCEGLVVEANAAAITDEASLGRASQTLLLLHDAMKAVEARRVELKKPLTQTGKAIDEIAAKLEAPMDVAKRALQGRIIAHQRQTREREEAVRRAAEEQARKERAEAEAAAKLKADQEAAELSEVLGEPVVVEPEPIPQRPAVVMPERIAPPSAVQTVQVPVIVVVDPGALASWLFANGKADLVEFQMREIKALRDAGLSIPGLGVEIREQNRVVGRRA